MEFKKVDKTNIDILFDLNLQLAKDEDQSSLFTANRKDYSDAFLSKTPISFAYLCYIQNQAVGFYLYCFKFASYLGSKVLYLEDVYFISKFSTEDNKSVLLNHVKGVSEKQKCSRIEMRVLKTFNLGYELINNTGFKQITKWDVYRFEHGH